MQKLIRIIVSGLILCCFIFSCQSEYEKMVIEEVKRGMVDDSLIFGMKMGITKKEFYDRCWLLNKQKLIDQGSGNGMAFYKDPYDSLNPSKPLKILEFFGIFDKEQKLRGMDMRYHFSAWGSFDKKYNSMAMMDTLERIIMTTRGGNPFREVDLGLKKYKSIVKIDGQRQIIMYPKNDKDVVVRIEDLKYKFDNL